MFQVGFLKQHEHRQMSAEGFAAEKARRTASI
jgi:hypothetical protein